MKKRKFILLGVVVVLIALLLEAGILNNVNNRNTYQTSQVLLDRVINVLDRNTQSEEELINSLKDDYIVRAKAVAYIIDAKPEAEKDVDKTTLFTFDLSATKGLTCCDLHFISSSFLSRSSSN